jgi:hypothetical protein
LVSLLKNDVIRDVLGQTGGFIKHAFTPKSQRGEDYEINVRPKSRLLTQLDGLGKAAHNVVTFGKGGKQRILEEEKNRVQKQLQDSATIDDQINLLPDEILIGNAQRRQLDNQLDQLKSELLLGNLNKREQERERMLKKKKKEEKEAQRRGSVQPVDSELGSSPTPKRRMSLKGPRGVISPRRSSEVELSMTDITAEEVAIAIDPSKGRKKSMMKSDRHKMENQTMFQMDSKKDLLKKK